MRAQMSTVTGPFLEEAVALAGFLRATHSVLFLSMKGGSLGMAWLHGPQKVAEAAPCSFCHREPLCACLQHPRKPPATQVAAHASSQLWLGPTAGARCG